MVGNYNYLVFFGDKYMNIISAMEGRLKSLSYTHMYIVCIMFPLSLYSCFSALLNPNVFQSQVYARQQNTLVEAKTTYNLIQAHFLS